MGGGTSLALSQGLMICMYIVVIFSLVFILYSTTAFLRSRKKEFGLLTLLGAKQGQIRSVAFLESMITAFLALASGLSLGILFSKLFFMAIGVLLTLGDPIHFAIPMRALGLTTILYLVLFIGINAISLIQIRQSSVLQLLKSHREPRAFKRHFVSLLLLGLALLLLGYRMALLMHTGRIALEYMLKTVLFVVLGSYFLFSQGVPMFIRSLKSRSKLYLRGTNIISINRLYFRLKDNANLMFTMAVLVAVVVTALGTSNTVLQNARQMAIDEMPYAISFSRSGEVDRVGIEEKVEQIIRSRSLVISYSNTIQALRMHVQDNNSRRVNIMSSTDYNLAAVHFVELQPANLTDNQALLLMPYRVVGEAHEERFVYFKELFESFMGDLMFRGNPISLEVTQTMPVTITRGYYTLVVADEVYTSLNREAQPEDRITFFGFEFNKWEQSTALAADILAQPNLNPVGFVSRGEAYIVYKTGSAAVLFIGMFISVLFFLASGSLIYFKLFTELEEDRRQFKILQDIGMTASEIRKVIGQELRVLFFLPYVVGLVHSAFALKALHKISKLDIYAAGIMIYLVYFFLQYGYYQFTRVTYLKRLSLR